MPGRPRYHVTAPRHWLNDPNGPVHWRGRWHVFYQHHPDAPRWGPPRWGHVSSSDLVSWDRHRVALSPVGPADRDGCWSGSIRVDGDVATAWYTGVAGSTGRDRVETVLRATSTDRGLDVWHRDPVPVVHGPPPDPVTGAHRDPSCPAGRSWRGSSCTGGAMT